MKIPPEIKSIVRQISRGYKPEKIILFGSYAYGKPQKYSDIDLAIVKKTKKRFIDRLHEASSYIDSQRGVDILVYNPSEWQKFLNEKHYFIREIAKYGKVIYEKQSSRRGGG